MAEPTEKESRYFPEEVRALRATGYEVMTHLCERLGITQHTLKRWVEESGGKILTIPVGGNIVMVNVAAAEKWHATWKAERDRKEAERSATNLPAPEVAAAGEAVARELDELRGELRRFLVDVGKLGAGQQTMEAAHQQALERQNRRITDLTDAVGKVSGMLEELLTRPTPPPPPAARATAKVDAADIVGALLSQAGRAALIGAFGTSLDASTSRQVIREAVMSALGSAEGRMAIRAAVHEALNGYDATKVQDPPYRPQAGGARRG